jgi:hypothetical protein
MTTVLHATKPVIIYNVMIMRIHIQESTLGEK